MFEIDNKSVFLSKIFIFEKMWRICKKINTFWWDDENLEEMWKNVWIVRQFKKIYICQNFRVNEKENKEFLKK